MNVRWGMVGLGDLRGGILVLRMGKVDGDVTAVLGEPRVVSALTAMRAAILADD